MMALSSSMGVEGLDEDLAEEKEKKGFFSEAGGHGSRLLELEEEDDESNDEDEDDEEESDVEEYPVFSSIVTSEVRSASEAAALSLLPLVLSVHTQLAQPKPSRETLSQ